MAEYKVVTEKDSTFRGKFDAGEIERVLNEYASDGWRVVSAFDVANVWKSFGAQVMIILERSGQ